MTPPNKSIIINILLFVFFVISLDFLGGTLLKKYYFKQKSGEFFAITYAMDKATEDIIVIGSSRARHHYSPYVFENLLHMSFYNAGKPGQYIFYYYAVFESIVKRHTPRLVILDLRKDEFNIEPSAYENLNTLLPYYDNHSSVREVVDLKGCFENLKLLSNIYPYNSLVLKIFRNLKFNENTKDIKGYEPLNKKFIFSFSKPEDPVYNNDNSTLDSNKIKIYTKLIKECKKQNIKLVVVTSPYYFKSKESISNKVAKDISKRYNIPFLDYSNFYSESSKYFVDIAHLNSKGADSFSEVISHEIMAKLYK